MHFSHFKLCQTAIFEPVDLRTGYIHLSKALKEEKLTQYLKLRVEGENMWPVLYYLVILQENLRMVNEWSHQSDEHRKAFRFSDVVPKREKMHILVSQSTKKSYLLDP